jgi:hypothetical protein
MCTYSMMMDYGRQVWPLPYYQPQNPFPNVTPSPVTLPTQEQWDSFQELCEKARKFDEMTDQVDCEDPDKVEWMRSVEERLAAIEDQNS